MKKYFFLILACFLLTGCSLKPAPQAPSTTDNQASTQTQDQSGQSATNQFSGSLQDLLKRGQALKCTWQYQDPQAQGQGNGSIMVSGNKFRGSTTIQVPDQAPITSQMLSDGQWLYQWGGPLAQGIKMNIQDLENMAPEEVNEQAQNSYQNLNQQYQYNCQPWTVDQSQFQLPANVNFTDLTQLMQNAAENAQQMQQNACAMCDLLPTDAKADCLQSCQ